MGQETASRKIESTEHATQALASTAGFNDALQTLRGKIAHLHMQGGLEDAHEQVTHTLTTLEAMVHAAVVRNSAEHWSNPDTRIGLNILPRIQEELSQFESYIPSSRIGDLVHALVYSLQEDLGHAGMQGRFITALHAEISIIVDLFTRECRRLDRVEKGCILNDEFDDTCLTIEPLTSESVSAFVEFLRLLKDLIPRGQKNEIGTILSTFTKSIPESLKAESQ